MPVTAQELESHLQKIYPNPDAPDMKEIIMVHKAECKECAWKVISYSDDIALISLIVHMQQEHREELVTLLKALPNLDQILVDMLIKPPTTLGRTVFAAQLTIWGVPRDIWVQMPDVVFP